MNRIKMPLRILAILIVIFIAGILRARAVSMLSIDFDEDDYLRAGQEYAHLIRTSNWRGFLETNYRPEHPPLAKIIIGISILSAPEEELTPEAGTNAGPNRYLPRTLVKPARTVNAIFGTVTVAILAILNPLAGFLLAIHTFTIKYVSQVMLEAFPALTSFLMAVSYLQWKKGKKSGLNGWLVLSAIFLGLTAASKYLYCVVGVAILVDWALDAKDQRSYKSSLLTTAFWVALAVVVFFLFDPYLWPNPIARLGESIFYHAGYSSGASEVERAGYPAWQPFSWLIFSPLWWQDDVFLFPFDPVITILALFGLKRLWTKERLYVLWLGIGMAFLLVWPTKWPQYIITLTVPLSVAAAEGFLLFRDNIFDWWKARKSRVKVHYEKAETRRALPWLIPGLIAFALLTLIPLIFQFAVSLTDFNAASIRDGFNGGIWRAFVSWWTNPENTTIPDDVFFNSQKVNFIGPLIYSPVLGYVIESGTFVFDILWTFLSVVIQTALGLGVALLLYQKGLRLGKFWQALFILPWAIPEFIGAQMWFNIFIPDWGWLSLAVKKYGTHIPFGFFEGWYPSPNLWLIVLLIPAVWYGFPFMMLAASAGLKTLPQEVMDAAAIDGANSWQTFRHITWPLLQPLLIPAIIVRGIFAFNQFYLFQVFYREGTLAKLSYDIFNPSSGFGFGGQFAVSAAINIITVIILMVFVILFNRWSKAGEGVTYA